MSSHLQNSSVLGMSLSPTRIGLPSLAPAPSQRGLLHFEQVSIVPIGRFFLTPAEVGCPPVLLSCAARWGLARRPRLARSLLSTLGLCWLPALLTSQALITLAGSSAHLRHPGPRMAMCRLPPHPSTQGHHKCPLFKETFPPTRRPRPRSQLPSRTARPTIPPVAFSLPFQESTDMSDLCYRVPSSAHLPFPRSIQQTLRGHR